ncbi:MAG: formaldehyde-activating enzyme [Halobacteriota archaeon]
MDKILIVISVFIHSNAKNREGIYANNYEATKLVVRNAMNKTPTVQELITKKNTLNTVNVIYHIKIAILYYEMRKTFLKLAPLLDYCVTLTSRNEELK